MSYLTIITCPMCNKRNEYTWKKGIVYVCNHCHKTIDFLDAIMSGKVTTTEGVCANIWGGKKKKGK